MNRRGRSPRAAAARGPGHRAGLDADQVLAAARAVVVESGVEALTMRRVADQLGVAPNALYSHFTDKAALVDAVLDSLLGEIQPRDEWRLDWREGLVLLMEDSRALLLAHAELMPHLMSRPMRGPNASRLGEETLAMLERGGISGPAAVAALRALLTYTFGSVILDAPRLRDPDIARREAASEAAFGSHPELPRVTGLASQLARRPSDEAFATSLRWLIDGISRSTEDR